MTDYTNLVEALRCENTGDDECGSSDCPYWSGLGCMDGQLMEDAAAAIEALQAQLPKRGEWIHGREIGKEWIYDHWVTYYEDWHCSNCKVVVEQEEKPKYNFCPNCGADMRKMEVQDAD